MVDLSEKEFEAAEARGRGMLASEPRASSARYDRDSGRIFVELTNGCAYEFPPGLVQDLQGASEADLANLEVDLFVPALVSGIFGTRAWMTRELARAAGRTRSPAKAAAARANGAKGGRPRRTIRG